MLCYIKEKKNHPAFPTQPPTSHSCMHPHGYRHTGPIIQNTDWHFCSNLVICILGEPMGRLATADWAGPSLLNGFPVWGVWEQHLLALKQRITHGSVNRGFPQSTEWFPSARLALIHPPQDCLFNLHCCTMTKGETLCRPVLHRPKTEKH